jgi:hypothetical protein
LIDAIAPLLGTVGAVWLLWQRLVAWRDLAILGGLCFFTVQASHSTFICL